MLAPTNSPLDTTIFLPLATQVGVDPVHFGLIFIIAATIGNFTPPVGGAMFVVCQILRCPVGEYTRESTPFLVAVSAKVQGVQAVPPNTLDSGRFDKVWLA